MTKLYVIEKPEELIGKTIACIDTYYSPLLLVTTDGGIMSWGIEYYGGDYSAQTVIDNRAGVERQLYAAKTLQSDILEKGICKEKDIKEFLAEYTEKQRKKEEEEKRYREEFGLPF